MNYFTKEWYEEAQIGGTDSSLFFACWKHAQLTGRILAFDKWHT